MRLLTTLLFVSVLSVFAAFTADMRLQQLLAPSLGPDDFPPVAIAMQLVDHPIAAKSFDYHGLPFMSVKDPACRCGPACACVAGECGDSSCPASITKPDTQALTDYYWDCRDLAVKEGKPLVVFVRQASRFLLGCVVCSQNFFPETEGKAVVIGRMEGGVLARVADLPGTPDDNAILAAIRRPASVEQARDPFATETSTATPFYYSAPACSGGSCSGGGCASERCPIKR